MAEVAVVEKPAKPAAPELQTAIAEQFRKLSEAASNLADLFAGAPAGSSLGLDGKKKRRKRGEGKNKEDKPKRAPTEFNKYMASQLNVVKGKFPNLTHREAFTEAAHQWMAAKTANTTTAGAVASAPAAKDVEVASKKLANAEEVPVAEGEKKKKKKKKHREQEGEEVEPAADADAEAEPERKKHKKHKKKDKEREVSE